MSVKEQVCWLFIVPWQVGKRKNLKSQLRGFPGGAVVENLPVNAGDTGSNPGLGRSHMPWSNWASEPQLLSLRVWSLYSATREAAIVRGPLTAMKSGPRLPQLEKALTQKWRPNTAIKINKLKKKSQLRMNQDHNKTKMTNGELLISCKSLPLPVHKQSAQFTSLSKGCSIVSLSPLHKLSSDCKPAIYFSFFLHAFFFQLVFLLLLKTSYPIAALESF